MISIDKYSEFYRNTFKISNLPDNYKDAVRLYLNNYYKGGRPPKNIRVCEYVIPAAILKEDLMKILEKPYETFRQYHDDYKKTHVLKRFVDVWPIVLDSNFGCVIEDGLNRFHSYVDSGILDVPCILFKEV